MFPGLCLSIYRGENLAPGIDVVFMGSKRTKVDNITDFTDSRVVKQLLNIINREDMVFRQKCSMFFQMLEYKKMSMRMEERNEELSKENAFLIGVLEGSKENPRNFNAAGILEMDANSKIEILNREIRRLMTTVCELEKRVDRREADKKMFKKDISDVEEGRVNVCEDNIGVDEDIYRKVVDEGAELRARLSVLRNEHLREMEHKQFVIEKFANEIHHYASELQEAKGKHEVLEAKMDGYFIKAKEDEMVILNAKDEVSAANARIASLEKDIHELSLEMNLKDEEIIRLKMEADGLRKLIDCYKNFEERKKSVNDGQNGLFEEEVGNLLESLDKSLAENHGLISQLEEAHQKNKKLESEIIIMKLSNVEHGKKSGKLDVDMQNEGKLAEYDTRKVEELQKTVEENKKSLNEYKRRLYKLSMEKESAEKALENSRKQNSNVSEELYRLERKVHILEAEDKRMRSTIEYLRGGKLEEDCDVFLQLEKYRKLLRCSLCDSQFKDMAIIKCMHCFCEECINIRIKMRDRKCPLCGEQFSPGDTRKLYL